MIGTIRSGLAVWLVASAAALLSAACAGYAPPPMRPGLSLGELAQTMGEPTGRYALPDGNTRVEYARGPFGKHTYMIDADAAGRVQRIEQVLVEANFNRIAAGMSREQLLLALGRPSETKRIWRDQQLWAWRYESPFCQWFVVTLATDGAVRDAGYMPDPMCEALESRDGRMHQGLRQPIG